MLKFALGDMHYRYNRMLDRIQLLEKWDRLLLSVHPMKWA